MSVHVVVQIFHKRPSGMTISEHKAKIQRGNSRRKRRLGGWGQGDGMCDKKVI